MGHEIVADVTDIHVLPVLVRPEPNIATTGAPVGPLLDPGAEVTGAAVDASYRRLEFQSTNALSVLGKELRDAGPVHEGGH